MKTISKISTFFYAVVSLALMAISVSMVIYSFFQVWAAVEKQTRISETMLDVVGLLIVSIAVFDVAIYLMEETVLDAQDISSPAQARHTLTKFMAIIIIAVNLEALVFIFGAGRSNVEALLYPTLLMFVAVLALLGLGLYQRLSADAEKKVDEKTIVRNEPLKP